MNSQQGVYMEPDAVRGMGKKFNAISNFLNTVAKTLESLVMVLKATAFIGFVGTFAASRYIETFKPQIEQLAEKCEEISLDLAAAADAYERGDELGSTRFH